MISHGTSSKLPCEYIILLSEMKMGFKKRKKLLIETTFRFPKKKTEK
jgi:hypothetical protein